MRLLFCAFVVTLSAMEVHSFKNVRAEIWNTLKAVGADSKIFPGNNGTIELSLKFTLLTLSDYDDKEGTIRVGYYMNLFWDNPGNKWDPTKFNEITHITVPTDSQWLPDIVPYKHLEFQPGTKSSVHLFSNGKTMWTVHFLSTFLCEDRVDGPRYPRDQKVCRTEFGSWSYDGSKLNLTREINRQLFEDLDSKPLESGGWRFLNASTRYEVKYYLCCDEPFPRVHLEISIERIDIYFGLALSVPGVVVGLIVVLLYLVPPTSASRITSQCICLLIIVFVGVTDLRMMGSTVLMAPAAHYFMAAMIVDLLAIFWSILTAVAWMQATVKGAHGRSSVDSILPKLEFICCLPSSTVQEDQRILELDDGSEDNAQLHVVGLSGIQRLILVLDRLFCLVSVILLLFLFIYLGV